MVRIGLIIIVGAMIISMAFAMYAYTEYSQTNYIRVNQGEKVIVGPVEYSVVFDGVHDGTRSVKADDTFVQILITAENISNDDTIISGGQLYLIDGDKNIHKAVHGGFSSKDLLVEGLEPDKPIERTTQFDIQFDKDVQYDVVIRPQKEQSSNDAAIICITNCN